jgi:hypothetical protein
MVTPVKPVQAKKADEPILVRLAGSVMLVKPVQLENAYEPMLVILSGINMLVKKVLPLKQLCPMLTTGRLSIVSGIVTAPSEPVYPVIVTFPSDTV